MTGTHGSGQEDKARKQAAGSSASRGRTGPYTPLTNAPPGASSAGQPPWPTGQGPRPSLGQPRHPPGNRKLQAAHSLVRQQGPVNPATREGGKKERGANKAREGWQGEQPHHAM